MFDRVIKFDCDISSRWSYIRARMSSCNEPVLRKVKKGIRLNQVCSINKASSWYIESKGTNLILVGIVKETLYKTSAFTVLQSLL